MTTSSTARALSVAEFADLNGVSTSTVRRLIKAHEIASYRIGAARRIPAAELDRLQRNDQGRDHD